MPKYTDVFVPGGYPKHTYNPRVSLPLETTISQVTENLCKLVTVTGHTKSGKTVLVRKVLPQMTSIWIDGGAISEEDDFWNIIINDLALYQGVEDSSGTQTATGSEVAGGVDVGSMIIKGSVSTSRTTENVSDHNRVFSRTVSAKVTALSGLRDKHVPIVVDDFHYIHKDIQGDLIRALKPLIFDGLPVVIIAIPHRRYDAVKVEKEMTGRIVPIQIPLWKNEELAYIPNQGFMLLGQSVTNDIVNKFAVESMGSPHLMQEFCRALCANCFSESKLDIPASIPEDKIDNIFKNTAEAIGRPIFEKLARGPQQRSDRIIRTLKDGSQVDIYGLTLHALAYLRPELITIEYESLRSAIKEITAQDLPQLHEVSRVLKHMSKIAATDQSSTPVIDFDDEEKRLHITDPFFAFYLRWGTLNMT